MESLRILLSSAGRRVELMECFRRAAEDLGISLHIAAADAAPALSPACLKADSAFRVPRCDTPEFIPTLLDFCATQDIGLVVPTIDPELECLARQRHTFGERGCEVAVSSPATVALARNKQETARFLSSLGIRTPATYLLSEILEHRHLLEFPIIAKPARGSSSIGVQPIQNRRELEAFSGLTEDYIAQEFIAGREFTINLFFDRERLRCSVPHLRIETRGGEVSKAISERHPGLLAIARKIGEALKGEAFGPLCFQAIIDEREDVFVTELNARFGGGYPLADFAGGRFALWLLEIALGKPCSAHDNWKSGVQMLRYDQSVFRNARESL